MFEREYVIRNHEDYKNRSLLKDMILEGDGLLCHGHSKMYGDW